jgi:hypothetical protein
MPKTRIISPLLVAFNVRNRLEVIGFSNTIEGFETTAKNGPTIPIPIVSRMEAKINRLNNNPNLYFGPDRMKSILRRNLLIVHS